MKKLLLTSTFQKVADQLLKILPKSPSEMKVAFVPTAADPYEAKPWLVADRQKLVDLGFNVVDIPLKDQTKESLESVLNSVDLIFVGGGNTFYLLDQARKSGFADLAPKIVEKGVIYVGSSAGSYLVCPSIEAGGWKNQDKNFVGLKDLEGLSLVPFILFAHYKFEYNDLLKTEIPRTKYEVKILNDNQAILVLGDKYQLVGKGEEVKL